ncbi:MAG: hypothetical protein C4562_06340 [Actinobacteria bacterium]|nr:MAG: hypothetical protein C4562_06340 [Actinomycetota bacterium]
MATKGKMTVREAGQKGGQNTLKKHGPSFYENIGKKGGDATSKKYGHEFYEEIGHKGGQKVRNLIQRGKQA